MYAELNKLIKEIEITMNLAMKLNDSGIKNACPFPHQSKEKLWLMPVKFKDGKAVFFLGHSFTKTFLVDEASSFDHIKIGDIDSYNPLIHLMIVHLQNKSQVPPDSVIQSEIYLYIPPFGEERNEIGWRCTESWYTLVIPEETLNTLRGKKINESEYEVLKESGELFKRLQQKKK